MQCVTVWIFGGVYTIPRLLLFAWISNLLVANAWAVDPTRVVDAYCDNRFAPIHYDGPLPMGFGLPGYVSDLPFAELAPGATVKVTEPKKVVDVENPKDTLFAVGVVFGGYLPSVTLPCQENLLVALRNRQLAVMPEPDMELFNSQAEKYLKKFNHTEDVPDDISFEDWNKRFPAHRRREQEEAKKISDEAGFSDYETLLRKGFVKMEKILRIGKDEFAPRLITGASNAFNVIWGYWFFKAREVLKYAYEQLPDNVLLASGSTSPELGEWFEYALGHNGRAICGDDQLIIVNGMFVEVDGAKHDAHMHAGFFEMKWALYQKLFRHIPDEVWRLVRVAAKHTIGISEAFGVKWEHPYRVRSGDPDTEKGNSVCTDFVADVIQQKVSEMMEEDATIAVMEDEITKHVKRLGYDVEISIRWNASEITFLSGSFVPVDGKWYWYPLPGRQLAKIGWTLRDVDENVMWRDYAGVLNSFRDYMFVPFIRVYVEVVSQLVPEKYRLEPPSRKWLVGPGVTPPGPSADTWEFFSHRYDLTEEDEKEFKHLLETVPSLPYMITSSAVERMLEVDMG